MRRSNAYRLIYSEGDLLPSLIVDVYDGHYVLQALSQGTDRLQTELVELLAEAEFQPRSIIERNDARVRELEGSNCALALFTAALNLGAVRDQVVHIMIPCLGI